MRLAHQYDDVALWTTKAVARTQGPRVWFEDGSTANLADRACVNVGPGDIRFTYLPEYELASPLTERTLEFGSADQILIEGGNVYVNVHASDTAGTRVMLRGTPTFHDETHVQDLGDCIAVATGGESGGTTMFVNGRRVGDPVEGQIEIHTSRCRRLRIRCHGSGVSRVALPVDVLQVQIDGSLTLECVAAARAAIDIRGSGDVRLEQATGECAVTITGSGNVNVTSGQLSALDARVAGSGAVFVGASVGEATLEQTGSGSIVVAHVVEQSAEIQQGSGSICVVKRGQ